MLLQAAASDKLHDSDVDSVATDPTNFTDPVSASETVAAQTQPSQRLVRYSRYLQAIHAATAHLSYVLEHRAQRLATTGGSATARPAAAGRGKAHVTSKRSNPGGIDPAETDAAGPPAATRARKLRTTP